MENQNVKLSERITVRLFSLLSPPPLPPTHPEIPQRSPHVFAGLAHVRNNSTYYSVTGLRKRGSTVRITVLNLVAPVHGSTVWDPLHSWLTACFYPQDSHLLPYETKALNLASVSSSPVSLQSRPCCEVVKRVSEPLSGA